MNRKNFFYLGNYLKCHQNSILLCLFLCFSYNLYFIFLLGDIKISYLIYLDLLLTVCLTGCGGLSFYKYCRKQRKKQEYLQSDSLIYQGFTDWENAEIAEHDVCILQKQLQKQFDLNCDLQDYIAKWCHEVKLPLAASLLMNEKIQDIALRKSMKEQLERINLQLNSALLGCKLQSNLLDIQVKPVSLLDCVRTSIRNNQFFLIQNHFHLEIQVEDLTIYSDKEWLVYVLDQLIQNAIKYVGIAHQEPVLKIRTEQTGSEPVNPSLSAAFQDEISPTPTRRNGNSVILFIEDHGEGIKDSDIRRIFEKGFTGSSYHNGKYKSTGMGLYMVSLILQKLEHQIHVESKYGSYTRFFIVFQDTREHFHL